MPDLFGHVDIATEPLDGERGREERGAFFTPDALALAICRSLRTEIHMPPARILEPGCGGGAFLRAAQRSWPHASLLGVDLLPACSGPGEVRTQDLFDVGERFDLILGNPDFAIAEKVVRHALARQLVPGGHLALLLRLGFLASQGRGVLFREFPLWAFQPIAARPSFSGGTTDKYDYALFVWRDGHRGRGELLQPLEWR